jgi:hypothetical protein
MFDSITIGNLLHNLWNENLPLAFVGLAEEVLTSLVAPQASSSNVPLDFQDLPPTNVLKILPSIVAPPFLPTVPQKLCH